MLMRMAMSLAASGVAPRLAASVAALMSVAAAGAALTGLTGLTSLAAARDAQPRFVISGRVEDPHHLMPGDAMLTVGFDRDGVPYGVPVTMTAAGAFATNWLTAGSYVLTVIRHPYSETQRPVPMGLAVARIVDRDVTNVTVTVMPDVAVEGQLRTKSGAPIPAAVAVTSCLADEGVRLAGCVAAQRLPDGRFVLRNAFGPRLLHVEDPSRPAASYVPQVMLDGRDITHVPTEFSAQPVGTLQIVLSPASAPQPSAGTTGTP